MALAGTPARYNKSFSVIRQYGPTFATAHSGIQYDCGGGLSKPIYLFGLMVLFMYNLYINTNNLLLSSLFLSFYEGFATRPPGVRDARIGF
jgi:hypothetical protein